ncbi:glycosyltransferase [Sulfurisoma sediminicola]|uniref:Glycosyltransferase involved in cell wall biosynthesis n=1 Tax=Sulfurisoma sediminicola TaxID=1381557 RepID=A0A497XJE6_9PROT|nr:glycosyltransferase [Sulfurisoma sediminicola]RLJ67994.1 glycosyltransferase involved in cell wall biosynthesis [Sulfurisoma sediminicola]
MSGKLLALAWMMPPLVFPRSLQVSRLLRALHRRDWRSRVVTVVPAAEPYAAQDARLAEIYRDSYDLEHVEPREEVEPSELWRRACWRYWPPQEPVTPDNWVRRSLAVLRRDVRALRPDVFVSFAQPWIDHVVGLQLKRKFPRLPWVAHFSDPWVDSPYFDVPDPVKRQQAIERERAIIEAADAVIFTTTETADLVMAKYPAAWRDKVHVVGHGFDAELLSAVAPPPCSDKFRISHTGNIYGHREPIALLRALATLATDGDIRRHLAVEFVGHATPGMREAVEQLGIGDFVSLAPNVPYLESLALGQASDLLLVVDAPAERSVFFPSKIVDYLMLRRPILAVTPTVGVTATVLGDLGFPTVDPADEVGLALAVRGAFERWRSGQAAAPLPSDQAIRRFDIGEVAAQFEAVLEFAKSIAAGRRR